MTLEMLNASKIRTLIRIQVMQAYVDGCVIEYANHTDMGANDAWRDACIPTWNWLDIDYRVKRIRKNGSK